MDGTDRARDAALAVVALVGLLAQLRRLGTDRLRDPLAVVVGVAGALAVEWAFLRYPAQLLDRWNRPPVAVGSVVGLLWLSWRCRARPRVVAAAVWGVLTYFGLLAVQLSRSR